MLVRAALAVTLLVGVLAPSQAIARGGDAAATHAYLSASYALVHIGIGEIQPVLASISRFQRRIAGECPGAAAGSPQDEQDHMLGLESAGALWSIEFGSVRGPIGRYARTVQRLHWSNQAITRVAHDHARNLLALAHLPMPDLCADSRAWSASGFQTLAPSTLAYDRLVEATEGHPTVAQAALARNESAADRRLAGQVARLERKLLDTETVIGFNDWMNLLETLGLKE